VSPVRSGKGLFGPYCRVTVTSSDQTAPPRGTVAAFFDLDKTVIAKASMVAFSGPLHRAGLVSRRMLLRAAWGQLVYVQLGASAEKLDRLRESVLRLTRGWDQAQISSIVREALDEVIEPIIFEEAVELIEHHRAEGHRVVIVSASPEEVVAPIARRLGVDEAIATRAELDEAGRYSGRTERYVYGPEKAVAIAEMAERDGIDLARSWAYSDSVTDVPMLSAVGHAVAVNPDRDLARVARSQGWEVRRFTRTVAMRDRRPVPVRGPLTAASGFALAAGAGAGVVWWWRDEGPGVEAVRRAGTAAAQTVRTFLAATVASPTRTRRSRSFFMVRQPTGLRDRALRAVVRS
jgi:HAD superfamily hydrolase (TIGR01490 family)